ncbi:uncharacterized protein LOC111612862 isoform X1 [Centruroides sculpturatus]|uniref:uncharacterized protein LOC111612862 isoform X1 n=1 Tax=Centruroides sculpturatus TaxID=218467 RepID=UPI000C6CED77|nr:uncharacterized protein LOC111612862 isoform X1 [Centruroides sculpturatus]
MEVNNCDEKESVYNSKEKVSGDKKEVTLEQSVETIVHIIMDLAARKKREEAKSSSSNSAEKLEMEKEDSLDLNETGEVMEEVSKVIKEFDKTRTSVDKYSWESESEQDDDEKTTKCSDMFVYMFYKLPSMIFSCWKRKK